MNDKEMIELAAKAVHAKAWEPAFKGDHRKFTAEGFSGWFDPLSLNAHAFVLMVKCNLEVERCADGSRVYVSQYGKAPYREDVTDDQDIFSATRRAIVRAAADTVI